jgi:hypothetical protein
MGQKLAKLAQSYLIMDYPSQNVSFSVTDTTKLLVSQN